MDQYIADAYKQQLCIGDALSLLSDVVLPAAHAQCSSEVTCQNKT